MAAASRDSTCSNRGRIHPEKHSQWVRTDHKFETSCLLIKLFSADDAGCASWQERQVEKHLSPLVKDQLEERPCPHHGKQGYSMTNATSTQCTQSCSAQKQALGFERHKHPWCLVKRTKLCSVKTVSGSTLKIKHRDRQSFTSATQSHVETRFFQNDSNFRQSAPTEKYFSKSKCKYSSIEPGCGCTNPILHKSNDAQAPQVTQTIRVKTEPVRSFKQTCFKWPVFNLCRAFSFFPSRPQLFPFQRVSCTHNRDLWTSNHRDHLQHQSTHLEEAVTSTKSLVSVQVVQHEQLERPLWNYWYTTDSKMSKTNISMSAKTSWCI